MASAAKLSAEVVTNSGEFLDGDSIDLAHALWRQPEKQILSLKPRKITGAVRVGQFASLPSLAGSDGDCSVDTGK